MVLNITFKILLIVSLLISCKLKHDKEVKVSTQIADSTQLERKEYDSSIYLGSIVGKDVRSFIKEDTFKDSLFGLDQLSKSKYLVEIRFYTPPEPGYFSAPSFTYNSYCTILYYDSILKIVRIMRQYRYDTIANKISKVTNIKIPVKANADYILNKLVENGIFSLALADKDYNTSTVKDTTKISIQDSYNDMLKSYYIPNVKELTKNGLKDGTYVGPVSHPTTFVLKYKVGDVYNITYMSNPKIYFKHNPDHQVYRRNYEIASLLLSGLEN